ncbi:NAD(P)/FAD-dependent oxidoreductase [Shinella sp. BYT-45]|uniref:NAD(P)/FAD-dependent oxidoreductase n=1 Tax=Shinella sp. BYT-45 TaxID=3377377 RepID=UPI0039804373
MTHIVVVGAGQAAVALAARLRLEGFAGDITLIGDEPFAPYERPPLSKGILLGNTARESILLRETAWYGQHGVTLRTGVPAVGIDTAARFVRLEDGSRLTYDELVFCTGAVPRKLPGEMGGSLASVHALRGMADTDRLAAELAPGRHVLVLGGGYIGLETAATAIRRGLRVTLVEMAPRILQRVACPQTSAYFQALHESQGVRILVSTGLARLAGTERVSAAELADGTMVPIDLAVVGIGVVPETGLAQSAGVATSNGIDTDAEGRTNLPHVWAAGDCANFVYNGRRIRIESVGNAIDRAETVARGILGKEQDPATVPWFWSDQYDCNLQIAGLNLGYDAVHEKTFPARPASRVHWYYRQDRLIACDAMNAPRDYMIAKRLIEAGQSPDPAILCRPDADLKTLLRR